MPALVCAGRRWLSGSDDFFLTGIFFGAWNIICTLLLWIPYFHGNCTPVLALPLGGIAAVGIALFGLLGAVTLRGRILEPSSRAALVPILYLCVLQQLALIGVGIAALVDFFHNDFPSACTKHEELSLKIAAIKTIMEPFLFFAVSYFVRWDSTGGFSESELRDNTELYHESWAKKVRNAFCCFDIDDHSEYFDHVAGLLAYLFQGHDIVPTDILAGMSLLGSHQRRVMRDRAAKITNYDQSKCITKFEISHQALPLPKLSEEDKRVVNEVAHFAKFFMATYGWALFVYRDLKCGLCKLACAGGPCCGCGCCTTKPGVHIGDNCCGCNQAAMRATVGLQEEDVIFTSFLNETMRPAFYVALDRVTNSIVIAIRGTMSLKDTLTDLVATPIKMNIRDLNGGESSSSSPPSPTSSSTPTAAAVPVPHENGAAAAAAASTSATFDNSSGVTSSVHGGILKASINVLESLCQQSIFKLLIDADGPHRDKKVKVIGHSLGAGCATLLTLLVRERFPELRDRVTCLAVSPPGGLLTKDLADYTKGFVVSPFVGMDVIPRLAVHNLEKTRDAVFECLSASTHNKNVVLMHSACPMPCCDGSLLPDPDEVPALPDEIGVRVQRLLSGQVCPEKLATARDSRTEARAASNKVKTAPGLLGREQSGTEDFTIKLYPPGRLLHYCLVGSTSEGHCCCGGYACGQSGPDGCCGRRIHLPMWVDVDDMQEIYSCPAMMLDHFPDRCLNIFESVRHSVGSGDYDGCFDAGLTVEAAAKQRREFKPTCFAAPVNEVFRSASSADYGSVAVAVNNSGNVEIKQQALLANS